jgi:hypothetical protein
VKGGGEHAVGQFQSRRATGPDRLQSTGPGLGKERVFGYAQHLRCGRRRLIDPETQAWLQKLMAAAELVTITERIAA